MSAILSAETLNDFIAPSIACIKPVETLPPPPPTELSVTVEDAANNPADARTAAQISLTDCLACSGCVTSSEAVLVSMQSHNEVLSALGQFPEKKFVALLSPQTKAALAVAVGATPDQVDAMVTRLLTEELGREVNGGKGFEAVIDTNPFRRLAHYYAAKEVADGILGVGEQRKPVLASSCPGFICYLESTHPELIPHLSALKSPQAIAGTFLKSLMIGEQAVKSPEDVYVVSIMPCFDKKLEGARGELTSAAWRGKDSTWGETPVRDVDCVITTREILSLAQAKGIDFASLSRTSIPTPTFSVDPAVQKLLTTSPKNGARDAGTSGGTLAAIINDILSRHPESTLSIQQGRNVDTVEYLVLSPSGETIAKLSRCYGFRNIQNLVRRLKPAKARVLPQFGSRKPAGAATAAAGRRVAAKKAGESKDDKAVYVEVMACPGGCTNGGGQIKWDDEALWQELGLDKWANQRELLARVDEAYFSSPEDTAAEGKEIPVMHEKPLSEELLQDAVSAWVRISGVSEDMLVKTTYRKVANDIGGRLGEKEVLELASRTGGGW
ncbi:iron hydrogenase [Tricharina praecox]|uniref:iron hydrogenase n=1 Tax=Tricharina praecox TaxID=43433 RepID=UPI00221EE20E|nr:iron hydrogenase [Tricharina praecox]KAI5855738.1 iron hydrogenase [Tricharina praecox]